MPNIAAVLRDEIARIARREVRAETEKLKRASTQYRSEIAVLKRQVAALQLQLNRLGKTRTQAPAAEQPNDASKVRFSPARLRRHRDRLELSADRFGKLLGVTGQTIYSWEGGTRPGKEHLLMISQLRRLTKHAAHAHLAAMN